MVNLKVGDIVEYLEGCYSFRGGIAVITRIEPNLSGHSGTNIRGLSYHKPHQSFVGHDWLLSSDCILRKIENALTEDDML